MIGAGVIVGTAIEPVTGSYTALVNHIVMISTLVSGGGLIREGWRAVSLKQVSVRRATTKASGMPSAKKNAWSEFGYASPHKGDEYRVTEIVSTLESLSTDGLKSAQKDFKKDDHRRETSDRLSGLGFVAQVTNQAVSALEVEHKAHDQSSIRMSF